MSEFDGGLTSQSLVPQPTELPIGSVVDESDLVSEQSSGADVGRVVEPHEVVPEASAFQDWAYRVNGSIAGFLGAPGDIGRKITSTILGDDLAAEVFGAEPQFGSKRIQNLMAEKGIAYDTDVTPPDSMAGKVGEFMGTSATLLLPFGVATRGMAAAQESYRVISGIAQAIARQAVSKPAAFVASDQAYSAASAIGGQVMKEKYPDSAFAEVWGQTMFPFIPAASVVAYSYLSPTAYVARHFGPQVKNAFTRFSPGGSKERVSTRVGEAVGDTETAIARMGDEFIPESSLSPAQKAQAALPLEKSIMESSKELKIKYDNGIQENVAAVESALRGIGDNVPQEVTKAHLEQNRAYIKGLVDTRVQIAVQKAGEAVAELGPTVTREQMSTIAGRELSLAESASRETVDGLFTAVPGSIKVPTTNAVNGFRDILARTPLAQREDIPATAVKFLGGDNPVLGGEQTIAELQGLRSKLLEDARLAFSRDKANEGRLASELAELVLADMGAQAKNIHGEAGAALRAALDASKIHHDTFRTGTIGRILGMDSHGAPRVSENLILDRVMATGGPKARDEVQKLLKASDSQATRDAVEDYLKDEFKRNVVKGEAINPAKYDAYIKRYGDVLSDFPALKNQIESAAAYNQSAIFQSERAGGLARRLNDSNVSRAAVYVNNNTEKAMGIAEKSVDPGAMAREWVAQANRDETGKALKGLKTAFGAHLYDKALDSKGLSGESLEKLLASGPIKKMADQILDKDDMRRLNAIINTAKRVEAAIKSPTAASVMDDAPSLMLGTIARLGGAWAGRKAADIVGTRAVIQYAGIGSEVAKKVAERGIKDPALKLITDAFQNEDLFVAAMTRTDKMTAYQRAHQKAALNGWLYSIEYGELADEATSAIWGPSETVPDEGAGEPLKMTINPPPQVSK